MNVLKGKADESPEWKSESTFDAEKDKTQFRQYENACERVKAFYKEQHGAATLFTSSLGDTDVRDADVDREANRRVQLESTRGFQEDKARKDERLASY